MPRGAITRRSARPLGGAGGGVGGAFIDEFARVTADTNIATNVYADLIAITFTLAQARAIQMVGDWNATLLAGTFVSFALTVDGGAPVEYGGISAAGAAAQIESGAIQNRQTLAAGAHTIRLRWRTNAVAGQQAFIRPVTELFESAGLNVRERLG